MKVFIKSFFCGAAFLSMYPVNIIHTDKTDQERIAKDWLNVGNYMRNAIENFDPEDQEKKS